jgi:hypothetical protein
MESSIPLSVLIQTASHTGKPSLKQLNFARLAKGQREQTENNSNINLNQNNLNINYNQNNNYENNNNQGLKNQIINEENNIPIHTSNYLFEIKYSKMKSGNEYFTIYNNKDQYCIRIKKDIDEPNEIYLQHLNFFESCAKNKSLIRKTGTIEMLLSILQYVHIFYGTELKYIFQDDSSITILKHTLKLNLIYILLYGKTWYMKNLNAFCIFEDFNISLQIINEYLNNNKDSLNKFFRKSFESIVPQIETKPEINNENNSISEIIILEDFMDLISKNNNTITKKKVWQNIKKIYKSSSSSRDFLQLLYKKYGMSIFIILNYYEYYQYISNKLKKILYFESYMQIPNDFISSINVIV